MKILLLGANGQVGWELQRTLVPLGEVKACTRKEADLEELDALKNLIQTYKPQIIVNAAAYTAVDRAEFEPEKVYRINVDAVAFLAKETKLLNGWLIHYSTDYVFDGTKTTPYTENDEPNPLSVYGNSKQQGENEIVKSCCKHLIFRTSWIFAARGKNFIKTIVKLSKEREELKIVDDQIGAPTSAELIADVTALTLHTIIQNQNNSELLGGTYHLTPIGETSWYGYSRYILQNLQPQSEDLKVSDDKIIPITTEQYAQPAKRPKNSRLNTNKIQQNFNINLPTWQQQLDRTLREMFP